ncbi:hypothetical protein DAEQUDRAFT_481475 [Daedalea quercina L-15889]|uniref:Uncharacterized protein n=1 Tax=Daedalea quercina L-15889 TaxID=1314783 RepID=A0A165MTW7_9APHY|nr:hypothetical protein DAEQUDRAFT_481475 [Daedalea quercina L-15889]
MKAIKMRSYMRSSPSRTATCQVMNTQRVRHVDLTCTLFLLWRWRRTRVDDASKDGCDLIEIRTMWSPACQSRRHLFGVPYMRLRYADHRLSLHSSSSRLTRARTDAPGNVHCCASFNGTVPPSHCRPPTTAHNGVSPLCIRAQSKSAFDSRPFTRLSATSTYKQRSVLSTHLSLSQSDCARSTPERSSSQLASRARPPHHPCSPIPCCASSPLSARPSRAGNGSLNVPRPRPLPAPASSPRRTVRAAGVASNLHDGMRSSPSRLWLASRS